MRSALLICLIATPYSLSQFHAGQSWHFKTSFCEDSASCPLLDSLFSPQSFGFSQQQGRTNYYYAAQKSSAASGGGERKQPPVQDAFANFLNSWPWKSSWDSFFDMQQPSKKTSWSEAPQTGGLRSSTSASAQPSARPASDQGKSVGTCSNNGGMNDQIRQKFLDVHNELRSLVANGKAKDGNGGYAPKAAAMTKLKYDCDVEKYAVKHAAKCVFGHSNTRDLGENVYMRSPAYDPVKAAEDASRSWFGELAQNGVGKDLTFSTNLFNRNVGHYTQMVWQSTKVIGCAVQNCPRMSFVVCNYKEAGNMLNAKIYETGTPCSKCPGGCSEGLCIV